LVEPDPVSLAANFFVTSMISWLHGPSSAWATPTTKKVAQMTKTMLGARMVMGSHRYSSAKSRGIVDRCSFENGQRLILFPPTPPREQDSTAVAACAQATTGNFGRQVARPNISVGAEPISAGRNLCV
jgi:hypothetical protein